MQAQVQLGDLVIEVVRKDIKNVHLSVHPPTGKVRIAAPARMALDTIRVFAISKREWIKRQQKDFHTQERETPRDYVDRESHHVWGRRYLLKVVESEKPPSVDLSHGRLILSVRPGTSRQRRHEILEEWYREQIRNNAPALIQKWEHLMGVAVERFFVQRMRTKWGSCNPRRRTFRLNTDLAKKPRQCLEYIVVHEMAHLLEPTHNERFQALMNKFIPKWKLRREALNRLPVRHENWTY